MKKFLLLSFVFTLSLLSSAIFLASSTLWAAGPGCDEAREIATALLCKRDQCPQLNKPNAKGFTPDEVYFSYCSSYGIEIRSRILEATVEAVIYELNRTRYPNPPSLTPPCECLAMLKDGFEACEVEQCPPPEQLKSSQASSVQNPSSENTQIEAAQIQGGCHLQPSAGAPYRSIWTLGLGLLLLGLGRFRTYSVNSR